MPKLMVSSAFRRSIVQAAWICQTDGSFFERPQHLKRGFKEADTNAGNALQGECVVKTGQGIGNNIIDARNMKNPSISVMFNEGINGADKCCIVRGSGLE